MNLSVVRWILRVISMILSLQYAVALNYTLYPREFADISCSISENDDGVCVYAYLCYDGVLNTDGTGLVDLRFGDVCEDYFLRCCSKSTPCADNKGKCVPKDKCGVNTKLTKYKVFTESHDCDWSGYTCCPQSTEPVKPVKSTMPGKLVTTKKPTQADTNEPEQCNNGKGTCIPESRCQNIHGIGMIQERSMDCSSDNNICCPLEAKKPAGPHACDSGKGICVLRNECAADPDGVGLIQERSSFACSSEQQVCCPLEFTNTAGCIKVGGRCVPAEQCSTQLEFDIRASEPSSCPTKGHVCCTSNDISSTTQSVVPAGGGRPCFNGGTCITREKCGGTIVIDRINECEGLVCCHPLVTINNITTTTTTRSPPITTGQSCSNGQGECSEQCNGILLNDPNVCGELNCCRAETLETCNSSGGKCMLPSECDQLIEGSFEGCENEEQVCCGKVKELTPEYASRGCGYRNDQGVLFKITNDGDGESQYGEFPWVVAIFSEVHESKFICGGSLIDPEVILTTADCVKSFRNRPEKLTIRAGEWDMRSKYEPIPHQERGVRLVKTHPTFKQSSLVNNIALLFLDDKFDLDHTIDTVCLPPQNFIIYNGDVTAAGWGSTPSNQTKAQQILKRLELPYNQRLDCERTLRRAMRKPSFKLDASFFCAGGYPDEDTCRGDAGSPVVFPVPDDFQNRMYVVGLVSWGIGCGRPGIPAAYTDVGKFRDWIDKELRKEGLNMYSYDYMRHEDEDFRN